MVIAVNKDDIMDRCKALCVDHLNVDADKVTPNSSFIDDLGCDNLDLVELVMAAEEEFGMDIPDDDAMHLVTVRDAVDLITKRLS